MNTITKITGRSQLRVRPASRGAWRVEDPGHVHALCPTIGEAEALAERLVQDEGGGEVLIYDAYLRLRTVKRLGPRRPA